MANSLCGYWLRCSKNDKDDAWKEQSKDNLNPVYQMANLAQGGELITMYKEGGPKRIRRFCRDRISTYLYHGGSQPHVIRVEEYDSWCRRKATQQDWMESFQKTMEEVMTTQLSVEDQEKIRHDYAGNHLVQFEDHEASWDLDMRGAVGETVLHMCFLNNTPIHLEIAKVLLDIYPHLALDIYEAEEYYGESCLHFAIVHGNLEAVKLLVGKGANVNQRATGRFFLPEDQKSGRTLKTNYYGCAYYGEYPLAFAACLGHEDIYDYLIKHGADPNLQDSFGNTVLHMTVIKNKPEMYSYAARHPKRKADHWIKNKHLKSENHIGSKDKDGLTPLALACKLAKKEMFNEIMELHRIELWRFSNVNCSLYPLQAVDSIGQGGEMDWNSVLMKTLNGETDEHAMMLQEGVLRQLLDEKWKTYVKRRFIQRLAIACCHLLVLTLAVYLRPSLLPQLANGAKDTTLTREVVRFTAEILTVINCLVAFILLFQEVRFLGPYLALRNLMHAPLKAFYLFGCLLLLVVLPLRLAGLFLLLGEEAITNRTVSNFTEFCSLAPKSCTLQIGEESLLILALPMCWAKILFFTRVTNQLGPLVNVIFVYVRNDVLPFMLVLVIFFVSYAIAFHRMYETIDTSKDINTFKTFGALFSLFHVTLGEFEYEEFLLTDYPWLTVIVFVSLMVIIPILLLNMLIAMMTNTFKKVIEKSGRDALLQWAKIVVILERTFHHDELLEFQERYSVSRKVDDSSSNNKQEKAQQQRGLMVIKFTTKTKAKQRKDALRNWQRISREILNRIKDIRAAEVGTEHVHITFRLVFPDAEDITYNAPSRRSRVYSQDMSSAVEQLQWENS